MFSQNYRNFLEKFLCILIEILIPTRKKEKIPYKLHLLLKTELWSTVPVQEDTHGLCVIEADLVDVWRMEGEHLEYNEAEGENVRLNCHLLVLYHLKICAINGTVPSLLDKSCNFLNFFSVLRIRIQIPDTQHCFYFLR
jgi:hypothetical protein